MLTISEDGNLVVLNGQGEVLWSSNVSIGFNQSTAQLTDDGNLVLKAGPNGNHVWQSFQQPTDTYLPKMRFSANARTGNKTLLMSWRSSSDPSVGNFSAGINPLGIPELFMWYNGHPFWRSGPWCGQNFIGIPGMYTSVYLRGFTLQDDGDGTFTLSSIQDPAYRLTHVLTSHGKFREQYWDYGKQVWECNLEVPSIECDIYGKCGPFGSCDAQNSPICTCLKGFVPKKQDEWKKGIWTSGCVRMTSLRCDRIQNGSEVGKQDGFMKLEMMKVPTFADYRPYLYSVQECKDECLKNCSCVAYSYYKDFGCMAWTGNLIDIQKFSEGGTDLNIRLAYTELGDTITTSQPIKDPEAIESAGKKFQLGFFSPVNSTYRYVGIWYSTVSEATPTPVLWVANRNNPINDSSGMMTISEDGNLVVLNGQGEFLWSSNVSIGFNQSTAQLTDDGNLILKAGPNGNLVWQSFQQPTDTYLSKMRLSANARTGKKTLLMSWRSSSDPSVGNFSAGLNSLGVPEFFIWYNGHPFWRSGPWGGQNFIGIPEMYNSVYLDGFSLQYEGDGTFTLSSILDQAIRLTYVLTSHGKFREHYWDYGKGVWEYKWEVPSTECDIYGKCGPFGSCDAQNSPICTCLKGFVAKNQDEWNKGIWTSGCVRKAPLQCDRIQNGSETVKEDVFKKLVRMKVPTFAEYWSYPSSEQECKDECLRNCSCVAYSYYNGFGCMLWTGNLIDIQKFSEGGTDLNIRLAYTELDTMKNMEIIISMSVIGGAIAICICVFFSWKWMATHRERNLISEETLSSEAQETVFDGNLPENIREVKLEPLFKLQILETATNNFDISKKLGQGGFGAVYRGKLPDGQEIAVKRLSRTSGQGLEEFMNEVAVISKLQHRNLVRLLGCCVEGEEMMLVYEYMPNKSLDVFLFG
ncbi:PREDICTED: G-type lectin S-receptor-like serine/threonine-protein kinase At1g11330 [Populus euphratica]|uniref:non-specific serine/threonine protein kinase n=1 Tax=Populus euphratica TaxID=75702 RepID=A0AAJ6TFD6_POPEU|nr:PREDICTED: G-type lectin S-receptor-like serine/threonine-protein kinase At1g11330 [Populus euphratica]